MEENKHHHTVNIIIDHKHLESQTPTTGAALYVLGGVSAGHVLFHEIPGPHEDPLIANDNTEIHLQDGEKFYSEEDKPHQHEVEIIIDRKHLLSPRKTTGAALYVLGEVPSGYTLYREVSGPQEDELIPNDGTAIRLHSKEKFYSSPGQVTPGGCCV
jgi:hypothetical protein